MATAISEIAKFRSANTTFSKGNIIFLIRIFLMSGAESTIDTMALEVASDIKAKSVCPRIRYTGKGSMLPRKTNENTALNTIIMRRGLRTDQKMPSTLRRYLSLKSFDTSEARTKIFRLNEVFEELIGC